MSGVANKAGVRRYAKASGADYQNHDPFLFVIRGGKIAELHEHLDTLYAFRALFEPAGIVAPEDVTWMPDASGSAACARDPTRPPRVLSSRPSALSRRARPKRGS